MRQPIVGILANLEIGDRELFVGQEKTSLNQHYIHSIIKAGAVPIILPATTDKDIIQSQIHLVDGLLLSGGYDVQPLLYGEEPHPDLGQIYPERDVYELQALALAYQMKKPILGICRGLQLINVSFGGALYQDISHHSSHAQIKHSQKAGLHVASHTVEIDKSSALYRIFEKEFIYTNSFHHQAIKRLAPGFVASSKAKDGIIESIEKPDYPFLLGVQWHPERMIEHHPEMLKLFCAFVEKAKERREAQAHELV